MAIQVAKNCKFPANLEKAAFDLFQDIGDRLTENQTLLEDAEQAALDSDLDNLIDQGNQVLDELVGLGVDITNEQVPTNETVAANQEKFNDVGLRPNATRPVEESDDEKLPVLRTSNDVLDNYGLLKEDATPTQEEAILSRVGVQMLDAITYPAASSPENINNIAILRKVFYATGQDLAKTEAVYNSTKAVYLLNQVSFIKVEQVGFEPNTIDVLKETLDDNSLIEDDYFNGVVNNRDLPTTTLVKRKSFLARDKSLSHYSEDNDISTSVFHIESILNNSSTLKRARLLGYEKDKLTAIMSGRDLKDVTPSPIEDALEVTRATASRIAETVDFYAGRLDTIPNEALLSLQTNLLNDLDTLITDHIDVITDADFEVTVIIQKDTITKLRENHSDEQIVDILKNRQEIESIEFNPSVDQVETIINRGLNAGTGTSTLSNKFLNDTPDPSINKRSLMQMAVYLENARIYLSREVNRINLDRTVQYLSKYSGVSILPEAANGTITRGISTVESASNVILKNWDINKTFNVDNRVQDIQETSEASIATIYPPFVAKPLAQIIGFIAESFSTVLRGIKFLVDKAKSALLRLKRRLDAFFDKHLSLTGGGAFDTSLLKCAINFDIALSPPLIDRLLEIVDKIAQAATNVIAKIAKWVGDIIEKLICLPINLLNSVLGQIQDLLPVACAVAPIGLPEDVEEKLEELQQIANLERQVLTTFSSDLINYRLVVNSAPDKVSQFKRGTFCDSGAVQNFSKASMINIIG